MIDAMERLEKSGTAHFERLCSDGAPQRRLDISAARLNGIREALFAARLAADDSGRHTASAAAGGSAGA
jgi:hypothetical protein